MFPADQKEHALLGGWLKATTCSDYRVRRSVLLENETHIVLKHNSHSAWCGRFSGHGTCGAYAHLYAKETLLTGRRNLAYGEGALKCWEGRIALSRVRFDCEALGVNFNLAVAEELAA